MPLRRDFFERPGSRICGATEKPAVTFLVIPPVALDSCFKKKARLRSQLAVGHCS